MPRAQKARALLRGLATCFLLLAVVPSLRSLVLAFLPIAEDTTAVVSEGRDVWLALAQNFLLGTAVGVDALVQPVRKRRSTPLWLGNLGPAGWSFLVANFSLLALPLYLVLGRFKSLEEQDREPIGTWALAAIALHGFLAAYCIAAWYSLS